MYLSPRIDLHHMCAKHASENVTVENKVSALKEKIDATVQKL